MSEPVINVAALEPLFAPHEEPNQHRARAQGEQPAQTKKGRRPSKIAIAQSLRSHVKQWRETDYPGASDTTRELLHHWFGRDHLIEASGGLRVPFRYYFCQREAMETLIYLYEVRGIRSLTPLVGEFGGPSAETAALGVNPDDDRWAKYAFKLATGAGKTKVMSLAIVWSYFHALRESNSPMAKHFVVVAPNLTVFERLKTAFKPTEGGKDIFDNDPLIPVAWRGDWNLSVVLQDEASGAATGGTLYLTNIHRLYDHERRKKEAETYDWMGPTVSRAKALDTGAELRKRITGHVRENIRATFVPLILKRTTIKEERKANTESKSVSLWKPFQVTHSAHRPAVPAKRTLFNLAPCNRDLEVALCKFLDLAPDVAAFCKNAGPQSLRVDYLSGNGQLAFYTPDFIARLDGGNYTLVETKGRVDKDVPLKAHAADAWCKAASKGKTKWLYLYVPQQTFEAFGDNRLNVLARSCEPALRDLLDEAAEPQLTLAFGEVRADETDEFITKADFSALPPAHQKMVQQAIGLFQFLEKKTGQSFAPVFTPLLGPLDEAARAVMLKLLGADIPTEREGQRAFFEPDLSRLSEKDAEMYQRRGKDLKRTLVDHNGMSPIGLLRWCLQYSRKSNVSVGAVFGAVNRHFSAVPEDIYRLVNTINTFRNDYVAHQEKELTDSALARNALREWASGLRSIWKLHH